MKIWMKEKQTGGFLQDTWATRVSIKEAVKHSTKHVGSKFYLIITISSPLWILSLLLLLLGADSVDLDPDMDGLFDSPAVGWFISDHDFCNLKDAAVDAVDNDEAADDHDDWLGLTLIHTTVISAVDVGSIGLLTSLIDET